MIVRVDIEAPNGKTPPNFVIAKAEALPFRDSSFRAIIANHSLEHFANLKESVREIGRALRTGGCLYIAVPDSSTLTDRIYRWLGRGGGHVNSFSKAHTVPDLVESMTRLRLSHTRILCTSFSFLNRKNLAAPPPRRLVLFAGGRESVLRTATLILRLFDRTFARRTSVYGWAYYFGNPDRAVDHSTWTNVCVRCGSAHSSAWLESKNSIQGSGLTLRYRCPSCDTLNFYTDDRFGIHFTTSEHS